jgi:hypothetical protein
LTALPFKLPRYVESYLPCADKTYKSWKARNSYKQVQALMGRNIVLKNLIKTHTHVGP